MADKQIDELSFASSITDATTIPVNNNSTTYEAQQLTVGMLGTFLGQRANAIHNLGDVYINNSSLVEDNPGAIPLWTGEYITNANNVYPDLYTWVKTTHPELCVTKAAYDAAITADGECKYFVVDEESGSLRFPKYAYTAPEYPYIYCFNASVPQTTTQGAEYTAALISKVSKTGDTMSGQLVMGNGSNGVKLSGADNTHYTTVKFTDSSSTREASIGVTDGSTTKKIYMNSVTDYLPRYNDGTNDYRIVTEDMLASVETFPLFYHTFQDHILNNSSWLRADTFSWQSGAEYVSAYNHLVDDFNNAGAWQTETIAGYTIGFKPASDGHKIVDTTDGTLTALENIYNATGVAWYYILDTDNQRFKLPRSKWNFVGYRDSVGGYVAPGLPNITGSISSVLVNENVVSNGAIWHQIHTYDGVQGTSGYGHPYYINVDASRSNSIYGASSTVQTPATQAYLYFYVGNTIQNQTSIDVGEMTEAINNKLDLDVSNATTVTKNAITGWCKPSPNRYIDLTLGASQTWYQAPANGMFSLRRIASNYDGRMFGVYSSDGTTSGNSVLQYAISTETGDVMLLNMPVKKGQYVRIDYGSITTDTFSYFRFIYDEGAN